MRLIYRVDYIIYIHGARLQYGNGPRNVRLEQFWFIDEWNIAYKPVQYSFETIILHSMFSYIKSLE